MHIKSRSHLITSAVFCLAASIASVAFAADPPSTEISNNQIRAKVYLPDVDKGFYRSTRFDWGGAIGSLKYKDHEFYWPWFHRVDSSVYDFNYDEAGVVVSPLSAMVGPVEEFNTNRTALGFEEAKPGGTFIKIGVGVLRKADDSKYDHTKSYEIVDHGKWTTKKTRNSVEFTQQLADPATGYAYVYKKTIRLIPGTSEMVLEHSLRNTGTRPIDSTVYDHNFWTLDHLPPGPGLVLKFPFQLQTATPLNNEFAEVRGNEFLYKKTLIGRDLVSSNLRGFGDTATDYDIRVEDQKAGVGLRIQANRPISRMGLWSIRTVMAIEPYIAMKIEPGSEFTWKMTYSYYTLSAK